MRLLLDKHLPSSLAFALRRHGVDALGLAEWRDGRQHEASDEELLTAAHEEHRVFVTYDVHSVPPLLTRCLAEGRHHAGVLLISHQTIRSNDVGTLLHALLAAVRQGGDWSDRVDFLRPRGD